MQFQKIFLLVPGPGINFADASISFAKKQHFLIKSSTSTRSNIIRALLEMF